MICHSGRNIEPHSRFKTQLNQLSSAVMNGERINGIPIWMTINLDQLHRLTTHDTKRNCKIDAQQFVKDLPNSASEDTLPFPRKRMSPKLVSLPKELQDAQSKLTPLVEPFDNNRITKGFIKNNCRALCQSSSARTVPQMVTNLKPPEIDSCKLHADEERDGSAERILW
jgi:hypothetical protein